MGQLAAHLVATLAALLPQDVALETAALVRFRALAAEDQAAVRRDLEQRVLLDPDDRIQAIVSLARAFETYPLAEPRRAHDPEVWAKGVAPPRVAVPAGAPEHEAVRQLVPRLEVLPDLHRAVSFDWGAGRVVRREQPLSDEEAFENLLRGYPPGTDEAVASVLAQIDTDPAERPLASYFEHTYADLEARAYEGVTLYEAWCSGKQLAVPDVDAIPFAVEILRDRSYRSPIPANARRTKLYQRIREHAARHRSYRTLREAAAAAFVAAEPQLSGTYALLVPRFHYLWSELDDDPAALAGKMRAAKGRDAVIAEVDDVVRRRPEAFAQREARKAALAAMAAKVRAKALAAVANELVK